MTRPFSERIAHARDELDIARAWDDRDDEDGDADDCEHCGGEAMHAYSRDMGWHCPREMAGEKRSAA